MRARDAENLIAKALTKGIKGVHAEDQIDEIALLGLRRSNPIYAIKIKQKENITLQRPYSLYRRILMGFTYPIRMLIRKRNKII
jgi:hypothetical protein